MELQQSCGKQTDRLGILVKTRPNKRKTMGMQSSDADNWDSGINDTWCLWSVQIPETVPGQEWLGMGCFIWWGHHLYSCRTVSVRPGMSQEESSFWNGGNICDMRNLKMRIVLHWFINTCRREKCFCFSWITNITIQRLDFSSRMVAWWTKCDQTERAF